MMCKVLVPRIKHAHVSDSEKSIKRSWRQLLFLHVTITSSFCGLRSFHQMLNKFKYCTQYCVMAAGSSWLHTNVRTHSLTFLCQMSLLWCSQSSLLYYWKRYKKGVDYKRRNSFHTVPQKGCKNKRPSMAMWIQPPYHFIKNDPGCIFLSVITERALRFTELGFWRGDHLSDVF